MSDIGLTRIVALARTKLVDESTWTRRAEARDVRGKDVSPTSPEACRWCVVGALKWAAYVLIERHPEDEALLAFRSLSDECSRNYIWEVNDFEGREAVLLAIDKWLEAHT